nr:MAG TPA: hypothetical protein [Caudoviricetes sp.]
MKTKTRGFSIDFAKKIVAKYLANRQVAIFF